MSRKHEAPPPPPTPRPNDVINPATQKVVTAMNNVTMALHALFSALEERKSGSGNTVKPNYDRYVAWLGEEKYDLENGR